MALDSQAWGLTLIYGLHMLATVVWVGGWVSLAVLVLPAAGSILEPRLFADFLERIQRRLDPLGWFCLLVLVGTGMFQMSESPSYQGVLTLRNTWSVAILLKHLVFLGILLVSAWNTWGLLPSLRRAALLRSQGKESPQAERLQQRSKILLRVNVILAVIVLALTALARVTG
jgi:uncharacterized membrane protein